MYLLMHENEPVLAFADPEHYEILNERYVPELVLSNQLYAFLYDRATKWRGRETYKGLLYALDLKDDRSMTEIFDKTYSLSLNDVYWIKKENDPVSFEEINLYDHAFDDNAAKAGFLGVEKRAQGLSPEFTTDGQLGKCFVRENDQIVLLKRGTTWGTVPGREMYSEYYCAQVLEALGIPHVPYDIVMYQGQKASSCPLVTDREHAYVPIGVFDYHHEDDIAQDFIKRGFEKELKEMILFDALVYNYDRHIGNFGYLKDQKTGAYSFFPLFDHGNAFFPLATKEDFENLPAYLEKIDYSAIGLTFEELATHFLKPKDLEILDRLDHFEITPHPKFQEDVTIYNTFLKKRIAELKQLVK